MVVDHEIAGGERAMLAFETLTLAPIDRRLIDAALLTGEEIAWLDAYHARVWAAYGTALTGADRNWLAAATALQARLGATGGAPRTQNLAQWRWLRAAVGAPARLAPRLVWFVGQRVHTHGRRRRPWPSPPCANCTFERSARRRECPARRW